MNFTSSGRYARVLIIYIVATMVALSIGLSGCTSTTDREADSNMKIAESVMEERPDSALAILEAILPERLNGERLRALHALLLTQARDKNYIDQTSDTLISRAVAYFDRSNDAYHRMLSHYYLSTIYYYADQYSQASFEAEKAKDILTSANFDNKDYWLGRTYFHIASIAYHSSCSKLCFENAEKAINIFKNNGLTNWETDAKIMMINCLRLNDQWAASDSLLETIRDRCVTHYQQTELYALIAHSYANKRKWNEAAEFYSRHMRDYDDLESYNYAFMSYLEMQNGNKRNAKLLMDTAKSIARNQNDSLNVSYFLERNRIIELNDTILLNLYDTYKSMNRKESQFRINNHAAIGFNDYTTSKFEIQSIHNKLLKQKLIIIILCAFSVVTVILYIFSRYRNNKTKELTTIALINRNLSEQIELLQNQDITSAHVSSCDSTSLYETLYTFISHINQLSKRKLLADKEVESLTKKNMDAHNNYMANAEKSFLADFSKVVTKLNSPKVYSILEKSLDKSHSEIISQFRSDFPELSEKDMQLAILIFSNMSSHTIALILGIQRIETVRMRKSRLKKIVEQTTSTYRDRYLQMFA